jgi:hypothetical protein
MKRFLLLVAVAVVAGTMYVAAAPGSPQASGPTAKQFGALKKEVATLSTQLKQVKTLSVAEAVLLTDCMSEAIPINQFGDTAGQTEGFHYRMADSSEVLTTALDVTTADDQGAEWFTAGTSTCGTDVNGNALRHRLSRLAGLSQRAVGHAPAFQPGRH